MPPAGEPVLGGCRSVITVGSPWTSICIHRVAVGIDAVAVDADDALSGVRRRRPFGTRPHLNRRLSASSSAQPSSWRVSAPAPAGAASTRCRPRRRTSPSSRPMASAPPSTGTEHRGSGGSPGPRGYPDPGRREDWHRGARPGDCPGGPGGVHWVCQRPATVRPPHRRLPGDPGVPRGQWRWRWRRPAS